MYLHKLAFLLFSLLCCLSSSLLAQYNPEPAFDYEIIPNCDSLIIQYTDESTNDPNYWYWTFQGGQPLISTDQNPLVYYPAFGTFDVGLTVTNQAGSGTILFTDSISLNQTLLPFVLPANKLKCADGTTSLNLFDPGGYSFNWTPNTNITNTTSLNPTFSNNIPSYYTLTITDLATACTFVDSILIDIYPDIDLQMGNTIGICDGDTVSLSAQINQTPSSINWLPASSLLNETTLTPLAFPSASTVYEVFIVDENNCTTSGTQEVVLDNSLQAFAGDDITICQGETVQLNASGGTNYQWFPATGLSDATIANPTITATNSSIYSVSVTEGPCFGIDIVAINVLPAPNSNYIESTTICGGDSIQLLNDLFNPNWTYQWDNATFLTDPNIAEPVAFPTSNTDFTVTITNDIGCQHLATIQVETNSNLNIISNVMDTTICQGDTIALSVSGGLTYQWSPLTSLTNATTANTMAFPNATTTYTLIASEGNCSDSLDINVNVSEAPLVDAGPDIFVCDGDEIQLSVSGADVYEWSPSTGLSNAFIATPFFSGTFSIDYIIEGTNNNGCKAIDSISVELKPLPNVTVTPGFPSTCIGEEIGMTANGAQNYTWSPSTFLNTTTENIALCTPTENITYTVIGTDEFNCVSEVEVTVTVAGLIDLQLNNDTIYGCIGTPAALSAFGADSYFWSPSFGLNSVSGDTVFANSTVIDTLNYMVQGTDVIGCSQQKTVTVIFNDVPVVYAGEDDSICNGDQISLLASGANFYSWSPADSISSPLISNPVIEPNTSLTYAVKGTNTNGCSAIDSIFIEVKPLPETSLNNGNIEKCSDENTILLATGGESYEWNPQTALDDPFSDNPTTSVTSSTVYTVNITNDFDCSINDTINIIVKECVDNVRDVVPSAFTPNSDNINETWVLNHPIFLEYPDLEVFIFNRWGDQLFKGNGYNVSWDGRYQGKYLPEGTYYYAIKLALGTELITGSIVIIK